VCFPLARGGLLASAIAIHESGHTIVSRFLGLPLGGATISPTDEYGGLTFAPGADSLNVTRASLREEAQSQCDGAMELLPLRDVAAIVPRRGWFTRSHKFQV